MSARTSTLKSSSLVLKAAKTRMGLMTTWSTVRSLRQLLVRETFDVLATRKQVPAKAYFRSVYLFDTP